MKKALLIMVLIAAAALLTQLPLLAVYNENEAVLLRPVLPGRGELVYQYTHSVEQGPVREYFHISRAGFTLYRTSFTSQGAGLPLDRGEFEKKDNVFVRSGLNDQHSTLTFRLSRRFEKQLVEFSGQVLKMSEWGEPGEVIRLEINSLPEVIGSFLQD